MWNQGVVVVKLSGNTILDNLHTSFRAKRGIGTCPMDFLVVVVVGDDRPGYTIYHISNVLQDLATKSSTLTCLLDTFYCVTFDGYAFQCATFGRFNRSGLV